MQVGIGVHEDALSCEALGAVASDGVVMIEVTVHPRVEIDLASVSRRAETWPLGTMASIEARSRFATPIALSGSVN